MTTSNAKKLIAEKNITMTRHVQRKSNLAMQKLVGVIMLAFVAIALVIGGDFAAMVVIAPLALAAVFSKEKLLDFRIFSDNNTSYYR